MAVLAIVNPASGNADPDRVELRLREHLRALEPCRAPPHDLIGFVRARVDEQRPDLVVACGGDGTVSAVATALMETSIPLGIVPTGTANLLARELAIPTEVDRACEVIAAMRTRPVDAMSLGARSCLCRLGFGRLAEIGANTTAEDKQASKGLAYVGSAIPRLFAPEELDFELEIDGRTIVARSSSIVVTNLSSVGMGRLSWGDRVRFDDGVIDVMVVQAESAIDHLGLLWGTITGEALESDVIRHFEARRSICIRAAVDIAVVADGEPLSGRLHRIRVHPRSLNVCVPR
ncbi:diacylglycerol/lipid kinase family protein [Paraliomyxa miuraensis]|uniref:diacylglycerol/lipid kinase family protein n=1 Tax=Paraliomyxa miuraensis TaxID=376150 RepID=UPI002252EE34|nr:diacylglycerol kinase family protein [Paraliomyxa miuraensis]MCX4246828.1 diacylglycerol kinase family protein [Paraliomyxa miuraensis]